MDWLFVTQLNGKLYPGITDGIFCFDVDLKCLLGIQLPGDGNRKREALSVDSPGPTSAGILEISPMMLPTFMLYRDKHLGKAWSFFFFFSRCN